MIEELFGAESVLVLALLPFSLVEEINNQWQKGGYVVATRSNHDSAVRTAPGVQLANGNWLPTGGTPPSPKVTADPNVEIHVVVRKSFADREGPGRLH